MIEYYRNCGISPFPFLDSDIPPAAIEYSFSLLFPVRAPSLCVSHSFLPPCLRCFKPYNSLSSTTSFRNSLWTKAVPRLWIVGKLIRALNGLRRLTIRQQTVSSSAFSTADNRSVLRRRLWQHYFRRYTHSIRP